MLIFELLYPLTLFVLLLLILIIMWRLNWQQKGVMCLLRMNESLSQSNERRIDSLELGMANAQGDIEALQGKPRQILDINKPIRPQLWPEEQFENPLPFVCMTFICFEKKEAFNYQVGDILLRTAMPAKYNILKAEIDTMLKMGFILCDDEKPIDSEKYPLLAEMLTKNLNTTYLPVDPFYKSYLPLIREILNGSCDCGLNQEDQ